MLETVHDVLQDGSQVQFFKLHHVVDTIWLWKFLPGRKHYFARYLNSLKQIHILVLFSCTFGGDYSQLQETKFFISTILFT